MKYVKDAVHYWCDDTVSGRFAGRGIGVAVLDTGIEPHPDFDTRIKAFTDCVGRRTHMFDDSGHGTHVAGIIGGSGKLSDRFYRGMAPQADLIIVKVLDNRGEGSLAAILQGIRWVLQNRKHYRIRIVNISVGAKLNLDEEKNRELIAAVEQMWDVGLIVVVSAGNYGPNEGTIASPGTSKKIITVGSSDLPASHAESRTYYSGCGPTRECVMKPDLVAPGYYITSCSSQYHRKGNRPYVIKSGSSMSTPVVSGSIALLLSKYPDMSNVEVKLKLRDCCDKVKAPDCFQGWGQVNVKKLLV